MRVHSVLQRGHAWDRPTLLSWPAERRSMCPKPIHEALRAADLAERAGDFKTATKHLAQAVHVLVDEIRHLEDVVEELRLRDEGRDAKRPKGA